MAVLFYFQFKSLNDIETTSAVVLRQLSSETADSLTRSVEDYLKRPHISVLLRIPQAQDRTARSAVHRADPQRRADRKPVRRIVLRLDRGRAAGEQVAGVRSGEQGVAERRRRAVPRRQGGRRPAAARGCASWSRRKRAIVAFTETINGRPHYVQAQLRLEGPARERMTSVIAFAVDAEKLRTEFIPAVLRDWLASVQQPSGFPHLETEVLDENGDAHLTRRIPSAAATSRRSTSAASRSSSSTRSCSSSRRRTSSIARSGGCAPATARSRFPKSSAPARGRSWR